MLTNIREHTPSNSPEFRMGRWKLTLHSQNITLNIYYGLHDIYVYFMAILNYKNFDTAENTTSI